MALAGANGKRLMLRDSKKEVLKTTKARLPASSLFKLRLNGRYVRYHGLSTIGVPIWSISGRRRHG